MDQKMCFFHPFRRPPPLTVYNGIHGFFVNYLNQGEGLFFVWGSSFCAFRLLIIYGRYKSPPSPNQILSPRPCQKPSIFSIVWNEDIEDTKVRVGPEDASAMYTLAHTCQAYSTRVERTPALHAPGFVKMIE